MDFGQQVSDLTTPEFKSFYLSWIYKYLLYLRVKDMRNWFIIITTTTITKPSKTITKQVNTRQSKGMRENVQFTSMSNFMRMYKIQYFFP